MKIFKQDSKLLLEYTPSYSGDWVEGRLTNGEEIRLKKGVFTFTSNSIHTKNKNGGSDVPTYTFVLGEICKNFYRIKKDVLNVAYDVFLDKKIDITLTTFVTDGTLSIFQKIDELCDECIIVGGNENNSIPYKDFEILIKSFPTYTERKHYVNSRVTRILKEYLGTMTDAQEQLSNYLKKKKKYISTPSITGIREYEIEKYIFIKKTIEGMLSEPDIYTEHQWQNMILEFILLLMPKYIRCLKSVSINEFYSKNGSEKRRQCDLMLVDANGNIDIIEIKKPFENSLISSSVYRDNYTPKKELSGSVMQIEKYLFYLNKLGRDGEKKLTQKYKDELPKGMSINITNPKGLVILGRDNDFDMQQRFDFEIMRRKFSNIIDIITYDDLLKRLNTSIAMLQIDTKTHGQASAK